jgi:hypothetical protein
MRGVAAYHVSVCALFSVQGGMLDCSPTYLGLNLAESVLISRVLSHFRNLGLVF